MWLMLGLKSDLKKRNCRNGRGLAIIMTLVTNDDQTGGGLVLYRILWDVPSQKPNFNNPKTS